jgi:serine/threonine protein kinase
MQLNSETSCPEASVLRSYLADGLDVDSTINIENHVEVCKNCENQLCKILESQSFAVLASPTTTNSETIRDHIEANQPYSIRYDCLSLLDVGGFGSVWKMLDKQFNRLVAVKVLKARHSKNPTLVRRFFAEAQICSQLSHPYIVPIHDMGMLNDGRPYFAMKLVEGKRLNEAFLKENAIEKPPRLIPRLRAFDYLCQAISFAHERSIIHRDLKPQNIMVGRHGEVQLMDWGLAKRIENPSQENANLGNYQPITETVRQIRDQTQSGALGTFGYMAPEQARDAASATERSDVFSLGAILYQLLAGEPPYSGDSLAENSTTLLERELERAIQNLIDLEVDSRLIDLIARCLHISPSNRPKNPKWFPALLYASETQRHLR